MDIKEMQSELRRGVRPSPDYPNLPNDFKAEELIAYDPKAELAYRMAKDRNPEMTRAMLMQHWRAFRIGRMWSREDGGNANFGTGIFASVRRFVENMKMGKRR